MAFGQKLQELRHSAGLTQEQFAEELQVSRQAVSKWESGRGYPEIEKILYICNRYGVSLDHLFAEEVPAQMREVSAKTAGQKLPRRGLRAAVSSFLSNLSPKNRALFAAATLGAAVLALLLGSCLKGSADEMTWYIWIGAIVLFGVVEAATAGLTSIWFVLGAVAGLVTAICGGAVWLQVVVFFTVSIASLVATRPVVRRLHGKEGVQPTNLDTVIGKTARVTEEINNAIPVGAVYIQGKTWSARSVEEKVIPVDTAVTVVRMEGVRLFVQ